MRDVDHIMARLPLLAAFMAGALVAASCGDDATEAAFVSAAVDRSHPDATATAAAIDATTPFAFDLYGELASGDENLVFSPHSIAIVVLLVGTIRWGVVVDIA